MLKNQSHNMPVTHYRIGIDPDLKRSGYCLIEIIGGRQKLRKLCTMPFWELIEEIAAVNTYRNADTKLTVYLEAGWLNKTSNYHNAFNKSVAGKIGKNVGENHCVGKLIEEWCRRYEVSVVLYHPKGSKWDAKLFKSITSGEPYRQESFPPKSNCPP